MNEALPSQRQIMRNKMNLSKLNKMVVYIPLKCVSHRLLPVSLHFSKEIGQIAQHLWLEEQKMIPLTALQC